MKRETIYLKSEYIHVAQENRQTTGGSQEFFKGLPKRLAKGKYRGGCGVVALGDLCLYLSCRKRKKLKLGKKIYTKNFESREEYREFFDEISRRIPWIPSGLGLSCLVLALMYDIFSLRFRLGHLAFWGISRKKLYFRIRDMLKRDIPVVLCIPFVLNPFRRKSAKIRMELKENTRSQVEVNGHFVTIIGMEPVGGREKYVVSSWGKVFYIDVQEYDRLLKSVFLGGFFGNCLCIV